MNVRDCVSIAGVEPESRPYLRGLAVSADGSVVVAAAGCGAVVRIAVRGEINPLLRTASPWSPTAVAVSRSGVYVLEYLHTAEESRRAWVPRVRRIAPDGTVTTIAAVVR